MVRPLIVAEVAQSHDGSIGLAHNFIDAIADAGADVVKFQMHLPDVESSPSERFRVPIPYEEGTRQDYWRRTAFTQSQWRKLREHCAIRGVGFLATPFSVNGVLSIAKLGRQPFWKVGSAQIQNEDLIRSVAQLEPYRVVVSTGMATTVEIINAVDWVRQEGATVTLLQCTTAYPCRPESVGLNQLGDFRRLYHCEVGLSDHSGTIWPSIVAASMHALVLEVHVTLSPHLFGPDVSSSITIEQLKQLREGVEFTSRMVSTSVDKDHMADRLSSTRETFGLTPPPSIFSDMFSDA